MKVIIADSNDIIRIGLRAIICSDHFNEIVGEVSCNEELEAQVENFPTDIILIDYTAPGFSIDIVPKLLSKHKKLKFVAITPEETPAVIVDALKSGISSYIKKDCDIPEILNSIRETGAGNKFFCGQVLETVQKASIDLDDLDFNAFSCEPVLLSEREIEIIKLIAEGNTNAQIAELLHLSPHTITTHRKNIMSKLGTKNTAGIVMYAVKTNLVSPNKFLFAGNN